MLNKWLHLLQSLVARLKENLEKLTEERDQRSASENREKEQNKRLLRQIRDVKEEMAELAKKEAEASRKKHELVRSLLSCSAWRDSAPKKLSSVIVYSTSCHSKPHAVICWVETHRKFTMTFHIWSRTHEMWRKQNLILWTQMGKYFPWLPLLINSLAPSFRDIYIYKD